MRIVIAALASALTLLFAAGAEAETSVAVSFAPAFEKKLAKTYGAREAEELSEAIERSVALRTRNLQRPVTVAVTVLDAIPNRPTFKQLGDKPGLSLGDSFGIGGARLKGVIRGADGAVLGEVETSWYESDIRNAAYATTWTDARRAIRFFARDVEKKAAG